MCTLVTRGQVASTYCKFRSSASEKTDFATPCAEKTTGLSFGHSDNSSTKTAPFFSKLSTTYLLCTIS